MSVSRFVKDTLIEINQRPQKLIRKSDNTNWLIEDQRSGLREVISLQMLHKHLSDGNLIFVRDLTVAIDKVEALAESKRDEVALLMFDDAELVNIKTMLAYVKATDHLPESKKYLIPAIQEVWVELGSQNKPPNWGTVLRWKKRLINNAGNALNLAPQHHRKGNRSKRISAELEVIIDAAIDSTYLTQERKTIEDTLNTAIVEVERENRMRPTVLQVKLPTRRTVKSRINQIDAFDRHAARYGHLAAIKRYRAVLHMNVSRFPLECAEIDHTKLDLMVVDEVRGILLGRPWITVCIDRNTRCILGIYISFVPPSFLTVSRCMKHAFIPKVDLKEVYPEIDNEWCAYGVMLKLVVDNGLEFHGNGLEKVCQFFGIDLQFTPRKTPWWKGVVERYIGTMNRGVAHGTPGTTFANFLEKDDYDAMSNAIISFEQLKLLMNKWVVDVYHQRPHKSLDLYSPHVKWTTSISDEDIALPSNMTSMDAMMGKPSIRSLTHKGIEYENLFYNSAELANFRRRFGDKLKVHIRSDEGDLGKIWVISPDESEVIEVPCLDHEYAEGTSLWQHKVCMRYAALQMKVDMGNNPNAWRHAKQEIREIIQRDLLSGKKRTNSKAKRFVGDDKPVIIPPTTAPVAQKQAELKPKKAKPDKEDTNLMPVPVNKQSVKQFTALKQDRR